jgi:hypothetical protein
MVDFKKALQTGLAANADAEAKRAEIRSIVGSVSDQLAEATSGALCLMLRETHRNKVRQLTNVFAVITGETKEVTRVEYTALSARRVIEPRGLVDLAEVEMEPTGYPVSITSPGTHAYAHDRESFERALEELLAHPDTGGRIQGLLDMKPKSEDPK